MAGSGACPEDFQDASAAGAAHLGLREEYRDAAVCLVGHAADVGDEFSEIRAGLDHLEFLVPRREDLREWADRVDDLGVAHAGVKDLDYTPNAMVPFRDPDDIQLEFFWRASAQPAM